MRESKGQEIKGESKPLSLIRVVDVETGIGSCGGEALVAVVVMGWSEGDEVERGAGGDEVNEGGG